MGSEIIASKLKILPNGFLPIFHMDAQWEEGGVEDNGHQETTAMFDCLLAVLDRGEGQGQYCVEEGWTASHGDTASC